MVQKARKKQKGSRKAYGEKKGLAGLQQKAVIINGISAVECKNFTPVFLLAQFFNTKFNNNEAYLSEGRKVSKEDKVT